MNRKLHARLASFVLRLNSPLGSIPFDRAIQSDLKLFLELRTAGCTWEQIASGLAMAGARRSDGTAISSAHIRSSVSRLIRRSNPEQLVANEKQFKPNTTKKIKRHQDGDEHLKSNHSGAAGSLVTHSDKGNEVIKDKLARARLLRES